MKKPKKINFFAIGKKVISNEIDALQEVSSGISKNEFNNVCNFLLESKLTLSNIPHLKDVTTMIEVLGSMGANITLDEDMNLEIDRKSVV